MRVALLPPWFPIVIAMLTDGARSPAWECGPTWPDAAPVRSLSVGTNCVGTGRCVAGAFRTVHDLTTVLRSDHDVILAAPLHRGPTLQIPLRRSSRAMASFSSGIVSFYAGENAHSGILPPEAVNTCIQRPNRGPMRSSASRKSANSASRRREPRSRSCRVSLDRKNVRVYHAPLSRNSDGFRPADARRRDGPGRRRRRAGGGGLGGRRRARSPVKYPEL
jgi:hypothetical protein